MEQHSDIEKVLFSFTTYIKRFHEHLVAKYQLTDIPYNVKGREFPKKGIENIDDDDVEYQFHGGGCTFKWGEIEINYDIDASSVHGITISGYPIGKFIQTSPQFKFLPYIDYSYAEMQPVLESLEKKGVLMTRKPSDLGSFHINEVWYESYKDGKVFTGANKDEIDWL
jgi:hypothetical protein